MNKNRQTKIDKLIRYHLNRHKNMDVQDVYKLLFQGVFGAEHLLHDIDKARNYLYQEFSAVNTLSLETLSEPVSIDGETVRLNFRPAKRFGYTWQTIWDVFVASSKNTGDHKQAFEKLWRDTVEVCRQSEWPFDADLMEELGNEMAAKDYPPLHHSQAYRKANKPAYRVVKSSVLLDKLK